MPYVDTSVKSMWRSRPVANYSSNQYKAFKEQLGSW